MTELSYRTALIVGVGAGLSASLARTFTKAGMQVALAARRAGELSGLAKEVGGQRSRATRPRHAEVAKLFGEVEAAFGAPDVVVYNASYRTRGPFVELDPAEVEKRSRSAPLAASWWRRRRSSACCRTSHGAILFTGASASVKGYAQSAPFAMGKFALRGLAQSIARELSPQGIHVAPLRDRRRHPQPGPAEPPDKPDSMLDPDAIAHAYLHLLQQPRSAWSWEDRAAPLGGKILSPFDPQRAPFITFAMPKMLTRAAMLALAFVAVASADLQARSQRPQQRQPEPAPARRAGRQARQPRAGVRDLQRPALLASVRPVRRHLFQAQCFLHRCRGARPRRQARSQGQCRVHEGTQRGDQDRHPVLSRAPSVS